jgi:hypothetical protein
MKSATGLFLKWSIQRASDEDADDEHPNQHMQAVQPCHYEVEAEKQARALLELFGGDA